MDKCHRCGVVGVSMHEAATLSSGEPCCERCASRSRDDMHRPVDWDSAYDDEIRDALSGHP